MGEIDSVGRVLLLAGLALALVGVVLIIGGRASFLGDLPGDLSLNWRGVRIYVPLVTSLLLSVLLTIVLSLVVGWRR